MGRWSRYDTDEERLPEGMQRVGYDADTQVYTYRDADGTFWEGPPGSQYGLLTRVSGSGSSRPHDDQDDDAAHLVGAPANWEEEDAPSWRHEMMPLLNWILIIGLFMIFIVWFITPSSSSAKATVCEDRSTRYTLQDGDTCWEIAENSHITVDHLVRENIGLDCDRLAVGRAICIPEA
jgi:hypothetical protein